MKLRLSLNPIPASRPRFVRRGKFTRTYYAGRYKGFLQEGPAAIEAALEGDSRELPFLGSVSVHAKFHVQQPKVTKLSRPRGDIDNYGKALLDILSRSQPPLIGDDEQVTYLAMEKMWAAPKQPGYIEMEILPL